MTPREQLKFLEDHHASFDIKEFDEVAAALRELDQLLSEADNIIKNFTKIRDIQYPEGTHQWILRAAQAGYGEK